ncbi:MAG: S-layer homology domain-containing protein [Clostridiales bacterium]|nr:S-layer homology domain-containing protein [Clostridiales bacterium]
MRITAGYRIFAAAVAMAVIISTCTGFTYYNGFGTVYFDAHKQIFKGAVFKEQMAWHEGNGMEHAYMVEANLAESNLKPLVFNGEVRATYTVGSMLQYLEDQGYKAVAAINGDIFDTSRGTPKGTVIHGGVIVTSGYGPDRVIAFDRDGRASMKYTTLSYAIKGTIGFEYEEEYYEKDIIRDIDFVNVPYGAAKGLHLFNRHYASSTRTVGECIEVVIDCGSGENTQLRAGGTIWGVVKSVNPGGSDTPIGDTELVLSTTVGSGSAADISFLIPGSEVEITVTDTGGAYGFENVTEAMGLYYSIVENGQVVTSGSEIHPRTALGIKRDGSIVLYVVDGRQVMHSRGLNLVDLANHMLSLGCTDAFNLDGGGSSVLYARFPGIDERPTLKNSPSEMPQRRVANALFLVYTDTAAGSAEMLHVYPAKSYAMPGADVALKAYASNALYEKASAPGNISYYVEPGKGSITGSGVFTAGDYDGIVEIEASAGRLTGSTEVEIVKNVTFSASVNKLFIEPSQEAHIDVIARSGIIEVNSKNSLFEWGCDGNIGEVDENGNFTAGAMGAQTGSIYIGYGGKTVEVPVQVGLMSIDFDDTGEHWARDYIGKLAARGVLNGMGDNMFMPDDSLTRAQFLTMLAKSLYGADTGSAQPAPFEDVDESEWYYNYVNWGYENGIVKGMSETSFAPGDKITREQMTVMLCNFARYLDFGIPQTADSIAFTDQGLISDWAIDYVGTIVGAGIMNGMPEGDFQPQGNATRAQAAKVLYIFCDIRDGIEITASGVEDDEDEETIVEPEGDEETIESGEVYI